MAKSKTEEIAIIDFTKFSIQQLPELQGKKEEVASVIKANPIVEIVDNSSYELAKKSRTAVKTLRTGLEKEQKDVKKKIKEFVLDVVDGEYDLLVTLVKGSESERQEPITVYEAKKEEERLEKQRLEEERVNGIKTKIDEIATLFVNKIQRLSFGLINDFKEELSLFKTIQDKSSFQEFEVLYDDKMDHIDNLLASRIATLTEQEEIRLEQIRLAEEREKQRLELERIAEEQRLERERFEAEQKAIAEKQRIAQEKLDAERKEFEEKQAEAKLKERIKQITDLGLIYNVEANGYGLTEKAEHLFFDWQVIGFDDNNFEASINWFKEAIKNAQEVEFIEIPVTNYHEADVDPKGIIVNNEENLSENIQFENLDESGWELIRAEFSSVSIGYDLDDFVNWLSENFLVPERKNK